MTALPSDFSRDLEDQIIARRRENVARLGAEALAWLVLPPIWTEELATRVPFPGEPLPPEQFLAACEKLGWCVRRPTSFTSRPEDAADLLLGVLGQLRSMSVGDEILDQVVKAAAYAINQVRMRQHHLALRSRLLDMVRLDTETAALLRDIGVPVARQADSEPAELAGQLVAHRQWREFGELLRKVRSSDMQRILETLAHIIPHDVLMPAVRRAAEELPPRAAAKLLATSASALPVETVAQMADLLQGRLSDGERGAEATLANLAMALASAGDRKGALDLSERLSDDRLRARALAVLAGVIASDPGRDRLEGIVDRIARVIVDGDGVDLAGAADTVTRLAAADALTAAGPVIDVALHRLDPGRLLAADVGALVNISDALRQAGARDPDATTFASAAVRAAQDLGDPAARAAGLARVLPVADDRRGELTAQAIAASRAVVDATDRADAFARLVPYVTAGDLPSVVEEVVASVQPIDPGKAFWAPDTARANILEILSEPDGSGLPWLREIAAKIGSSVLEVKQKGLVPAALRRWAILASTLDPDNEAGIATGRALLARVDPLLTSGETAEALGWIETGRRLLTILHGTFDTSVLVATRGVELAQRRSDDRRLLTRFLARKEQIAAFRQLLTIPDGKEPWALHYLGHGGVGKTMLLRHIAAELAPAAGWLVARIDFDHLNPEFPLQRPGQLLLDILEELEAYSDAENRPLYEDARLFLGHQQWWREGVGASVHHDLPQSGMDQAVQCFCAFLRALPKPVVLILDTCEELAKFQPTGATLPQLDAALRVLERIHGEVSSVRVVLAGRRPLARITHGPHKVDPARLQPCLPGRKTYLAVHEITGFTEPEARQYLREMEGLTLPDETVRELLNRSVDELHQPSGANIPSSRRAARYVPFDLAQYAAILRDDPSYLAQTPRSEAYVTYVRDRIVTRQGRFSQPVLASAVLMRRFNREMLAATHRDAEPVLDEAWRELATTEWISTHVDAALHTTFLEVDRAMLERLDAYYNSPDQRAEYDRAREQVADGLERLVGTSRLAELTVEPVDAALRSLPSDRAAALCDTLALRVAREGRWMWAFNVFSRVLSLDGALASPGHPAAASAIALYTTALAWIDPSVSRRSQWKATMGKASRHPRRLTARWLQVRAEVLVDPADNARWRRAMKLVSELMASDQYDDRARAAWLVGTVLAAASRAIDAAAMARRPTAAANWADAAEEVIGFGFGPQVSAVTAVLLARAFLLDGDTGKASKYFARALAFADAIGSEGPVAEAAADGGVPPSPRDRVRLEAALAVPMTDENAAEWLWQAVAAVAERTQANMIADADSDRLAALLLTRQLDEQPVPVSDLERVQQAVGKMPPAPASIYSHRQVPVLRVALSRCWLAHAQVAPARAVLRSRGPVAMPDDERRLLDLARVEIARRQRLPRSDSAVRSKLRENLPLARAARLHEAAVLLGDPPPPRPVLAGTPENLHTWWRVHASPRQPADARDLAAALTVGPSWCPAGQQHIAAALRLDAVELSQMPHGPSPDSDRRIAELHPGSWYQQNPGRLEDAWRLALRGAALSTSPRDRLQGLGASGTPAFADLPRIGPRRLAELALEEGELLALRLPGPGGCLLDAAAALFERTNDKVGRLIAYTAARLAALQAGLQVSRADLEAVYRDARTVARNLPDWPDLLSRARRSSARVPQQRRTRSGWEGWLLRLAWLVAEPGSSVRRELDPQNTAVPPELLRGRARDTARAIPVIAKHAGPPPATRYAQGKARRPPRDKVLRAAIRAFAALAAALGGLVLYGLVASSPDMPPGLSAPALRIAFYTCIVLALASAAGLRIANGGPRNNWARVWFFDTSRPDTARVTVMSTASRRWPVPPKRYSARVVVGLDDGMPVTGKTTVHDVLAAAARPPHPLRVSLIVSQRLTGVAWEAWLASSLDNPPPLYMERPYPRYPGSVTDPIPSCGTYWVLAPQRWRGLIRAALPADATNISARFLDGRGESSRRLADVGPLDVIIAMATAVQTPEGRRLVVQQENSPDTDLMIEPDDAALGGVSVIVVGEPARNPGIRSDSALRGCAADLVQAGLQTVVVVPSAPAGTTFQVLAKLTDALRPGAPSSGSDLAVAVHQARQLLAGSGEDSFGYELTLMARA